MLDLNEHRHEDQDDEDDFDFDDEALSKRQQEIEDAHVDDGVAKRTARAFKRLQRRAASLRREGRGILLTGPSGTGKTHALGQLAVHKTFESSETPDGIIRPVVRISAPAPCTLKTLGRRIFQELTNTPARERLVEHEIWNRVRAHLAAQKVRYLFIDEVHHTLIGRNQEEQRKVAETFKTVMQIPGWPVNLVLAGMPEFLPFMRQHRQLYRRMIKLSIRRFPAGKIGEKAICRHAEILIEKLGVSVDFDLEAMAPRLHIASSGYPGICAQLFKDAAELALDANETVLGVEDLADAYNDIHSTGEEKLDDETNPFLCPDLSLASRIDVEERGRETSLVAKGPTGSSK